jgi:Flp pilus assembly protein TadB
MTLLALGAFAAALAVYCLLLLIRSFVVKETHTEGADETGLRAWYSRQLANAARTLAQARLNLSPRRYLALLYGAPAVLGFVGLIMSPALAVAGVVAGLGAPRLFVRYLVAGEARDADDDAPRVLRAMINRATVGGVYRNLYEAGMDAARHRWVKADLEELVSRSYMTHEQAGLLHELAERQAGRNLRLIFYALAVLVETHQPINAAADVLNSINTAAQQNQSIAKQAAAEGRGLRLQAIVLAIAIPALFAYLALVNPPLVDPVLHSDLGTYVLLPGAAALEIAGIVISWRVTKLEI